MPDWVHLPPRLYRRGPKGGSHRQLCLRLLIERKGKLKEFPELLNVRLRLELLERLEHVGFELKIRGRRWRIYVKGD